MFKIATRIFRPISSWVTRSKFWQWMKTPQARIVGKVASAGITAYSIGSTFIPSKTDSVAHNEAAADFLIDNFFPPEICLALAQPINDVQAVAHAAAMVGLSYVDEQHDATSLRSFSFLCLSEYLPMSPDSTLLEPHEIKEIVVQEMDAFLRSMGVSESDGTLGDVTTDALDDIDFEGMPIELLRRYDFLAFIINAASELSLNEDGSVSRELRESPRAVVKSQPGSVKMGLS